MVFFKNDRFIYGFNLFFRRKNTGLPCHFLIIEDKCSTSSIIPPSPSFNTPKGPEEYSTKPERLCQKETMHYKYMKTFINYRLSFLLKIISLKYEKVEEDLLSLVRPLLLNIYHYNANYHHSITLQRHMKLHNMY